MKQTPEEYFREQQRLQQLVSKFEESLFGNNISAWFDSEDIEDICNYYIDHDNLSKANEALQVGLQMHPTDGLLQMLRAHLLIEESKPTEALKVLETLNCKDDFYWHYLRLGAYSDLKKWKLAETEASRHELFDQFTAPIRESLDKMGFKYIIMPQQTQIGGIWVTADTTADRWKTGYISAASWYRPSHCHTRSQTRRRSFSALRQLLYKASGLNKP